jgi:hypothetical protein
MLQENDMTTFTTEDRISSMPRENIPRSRTIIKLMNIADDCHRTVKDLKDPDLAMRLKLVANLVAGILNDYHGRTPK